jgi:hypothetical protein
VADEKPSVPLADDHAVTMFYAFALDLLAETEAQHRAVIDAHARLESYVAEWRTNPPTPARRLDRLSVLAAKVREVIAAARSQRALAVNMQNALAALRANAKQS